MLIRVNEEIQSIVSLRRLALAKEHHETA